MGLVSKTQKLGAYKLSVIEIPCTWHWPKANRPRNDWVFEGTVCQRSQMFGVPKPVTTQPLKPLLGPQNGSGRKWVVKTEWLSKRMSSPAFISDAATEEKA